VRIAAQYTVRRLESAGVFDSADAEQLPAGVELILDGIAARIPSPR
jgi:hypothetical protein